MSKSRHRSNNKASLGLSLAFAGVLAIGLSHGADPVMPTGPWKELLTPNLAGWSSVGSPPFTMVNGQLQCKGYTTSKTHLIWHELLKDVEISATYKLSSDNANSGIQVRSRCTDTKSTAPDCANYQVCGTQLDVAKAYSGLLFKECAGFYTPKVDHTVACRQTVVVNQFMTTVARFDGANVSLWLNGVHCLDHTVTLAEDLVPGVFSIQSHPPYDLITWSSIKIRKLHVKGCMNSAASNYNPEATEDDGSCKTVSTNGALARTMLTPSISVSASKVSYSIPRSGKFSVRILDVNGAEATHSEGVGPISGSLNIAHAGIYFVEVKSAGILSRKQINNF